MAFYSDSKVSTHIVDPVTHRVGFLTEFHITNRDSAILTNMKLVNLGATSANPSKYNALGGALNCIKRIRLMDGRAELDSLNNVKSWVGFQNIRDTNAKEVSVQASLKKTSLGFALKAQASENTIKPYYAGPDVTSVEDTTPSAYVDLRQLFPLLQETESLHTTIFKNLRIVIEWESDQKLVLQKNDGPGTVQAITPALIYDVIEDESIGMKLMADKSVEYNQIEHDEFVVGAITVAGGGDPKKQTTQVKLNGFNNKKVERILMSAEYQDVTKNFASNDIIGFGASGCVCGFKSNQQVRVNGANKLPGVGCDKDNKRLALLTDTWGEIDCYPSANNLGLDRAATQLTGGLVPNQMGWFGMYLNEQVSDLQFTYERVGLDEASATVVSQTNEALRVHLYGEVKKILVVENGEYAVKYA